MPNPTPLSVSVRDASELTSFSEYEIRTAVNKGELAAVKRGRRIAILLPDLNRWLESLPKVVESEAS
jgi:hypothetical protein